MRILIVHNHYGDHAIGGEAQVMRAEAELLRAHGHEVYVYERTNAEIRSRSLLGRLHVFWSVPWSYEGYQAIARTINAFRPDIMHVHNYWLLLSPSVFAAAKDRGVATVLTLHNYRLICPGGQLRCRDRICEECVGRAALRVLWRNCYPDGKILKSLTSLRLYNWTRNHAYLDPWVDAYVVHSEFARSMFIRAGLPPGKVHIKPNFTVDPLCGGTADDPGEGAIFVGRLSPEKGLRTLVRAWREIPYPVRIVGDGPLRSELEKAASANVAFLGWRTHAEVLQLMSAAACMVFPSEWYETSGLVLLEAMALGRPVVATDLGPRRETVIDGTTGMLFSAGDESDLRRQAVVMLEDHAKAREMGQNARQEYLNRYTPGHNYPLLMGIYECARGHANDLSARHAVPDI